jgi:hypothetical protein
MLVIEQQNGILFIYENATKYYDEIEEFPIEIPIEEAIAIVEIPGIGKNVSMLLYDLSSLPWIGKSEFNQVMKYLKENFTSSNISWEETKKYFGDFM